MTGRLQVSAEREARERERVKGRMQNRRKSRSWRIMSCRHDRRVASGGQIEGEEEEEIVPHAQTVNSKQIGPLIIQQVLFELPL